MAISLVAKAKAFDPLETKVFRGNLGTYATGGVAIAPADVGLRVILAVIPMGGNDLTRRYAFDPVNSKIMSMVTSTGAETANATDLSSINFDFVVIGY